MNCDQQASKTDVTLAGDKVKNLEMRFQPGKSMTEYKHLLVTGNRGFIGSHFIRCLFEACPNIRVTMADNPKCTARHGKFAGRKNNFQFWVILTTLWWFQIFPE